MCLCVSRGRLSMCCVFLIPLTFCPTACLYFCLCYRLMHVQTIQRPSGSIYTLLFGIYKYNIKMCECECMQHLLAHTWVCAWVTLTQTGPTRWHTLQEPRRLSHGCCKPMCPCVHAHACKTSWDGLCYWTFFIQLYCHCNKSTLHLNMSRRLKGIGQHSAR